MMRRSIIGAVLCLCLQAGMARADWDLEKMVTREGGRVTYNARDVAPKFRNPWPDRLEAEFQKRAHGIITAQRRDTKAGVNTYFENEKRSYGFLMAHVLGGNAAEGMKHLQSRDHQHQAWHRETEGIDYYACFTLKHQMRKYFYFGDLMDPAYRKQMFEGAKKWTARDPLRRPHYAFDRKSGWGPDARNSWVDIRTTENLYLMRVTSVYLMAEETGNAETTALYKKHLLNYTRTLYRIGMGEWDSENYHGHSITPLLNLYDFARDEEVKGAAKACLDFYCAAGAVKYWRGGFNGPTKRDYNHAQPFGGSAASSLWVWFGDHPKGKTDHWESDEVHQITSAYRPPLAVVNLARKRVDRPVEIFAAKPEYSATTEHRFDSAPEHLETQYLAHSYQIGSLTGGTSVDGGDVNGFKILAYDGTDGAIALQAAPSSNPYYPGSPMYKKGIVPFQNRVAQLENIALWLAKDGKAPWLWVIPESVKVTTEEGITFFECDRTWVAIRPLGIDGFRADPCLSRPADEKKGEHARFPGHQAWTARGNAIGFCGMAIEVGEKESHATFAAFRKAAKAAKVDVTRLEKGNVTYVSASGKRLEIQWSDKPLELGVLWNGKHRDLPEDAKYLYRSPVIRSVWGSGILEVKAGGHAFRCEVDADGKAKFE